MRGPLRLVSAFALIAVSTAFLAQPGSAGSRPRWVLHVEHFPGGISGGPRARLEAAGGGAAGGGAAGRRARLASPRLSTGDPANLQANTDCTPPLPQDETSVAFNVFDPMNAVVAANDFCGDGYWIGHTTDGGQTWTSEFKDPKTSTGDRCFGSDPSVVFSRRDSAF